MIHPVTFLCVAVMAVFFLLLAGYWRERAQRAEWREKMQDPKTLREWMK